MTDRIEHGITRAVERIEATTELADTTVARLSGGTATAESGDGTVAATAGPGGRLVHVRVAEQALRLGPEGLAREILRLTEQAGSRATQRMRSALSPGLDPRVESGLDELGLRADEAPDDEDGWTVPGRRR
ncbi:YbaB/EbfC family nucleoid-associated protein [Actinoalloteichus spitiensis]|uniref:YbaB/EbfC family nucleoid-associated protein n=1 Tax=Actinoalloteichus spitiensis TaxID=252394 RepID=UPI00035D3FF9|nr:YbaB/EbfC family nucleoid-associated protein [Actinoalloteichus spitiensis]